MNAFDTCVGVTYTTSLNIHIDRASAVPYLVDLALNIIRTYRTIKANDFTLYPSYMDDLVYSYCDGSYSCAILNMLNHNAEVLYSLLEDCVTNGSALSLHLFTHTSANGKYVWELLPLALKEYQAFLTQLSKTDEIRDDIMDDIREDISSNLFVTRDFTKYNEAFSNLMKK